MSPSCILFFLAAAWRGGCWATGQWFVRGSQYPAPARAQLIARSSEPGWGQWKFASTAHHTSSPMLHNDADLNWAQSK